jgi:hypothetical protein
MNSGLYKRVLALLALIYIPYVNGQDLYNTYNHFNLLFESSNKVNPYYFSGNPAYLNYDGRDQLLSVKGSMKNEDGDFKEFFDPGKIRNYDLSFSGKKILDSNQTFKGLFAIQKQQRKDWNFLATKDYNTGSPFLMGDSTTGSTRYNGILMNAQYSVKLWKSLLTGISLNYYVDEGLKEVSPRPTTEHRDIDVSAGLGYIINPNLSAGFTFRVYDKNEKIKYAEDEGAVYNETILFKIRGFDLPERNAKKTEVRYSYNNGYEGKIDGFYKNDAVSAVVFAGNTFEHITLKDNENNPEPEGYWRNNSVSAGAEAMINLCRNLSAGCMYVFDNDDMWARHPVYNVLMNSSKNYEHKFGAGVQYGFNNNFTAGLELSGSFRHVKYEDYYSNVFYSLDRLTLTPQLGINYVWSKLLLTHVAAGYIKSNANNFDFTGGTGNSSFYNSFTGKDINYISADYNGMRYTFKAEINPGKFGLINLYATYLHLDAGDNVSAFYNGRSDLQATIEFKIKVY